jgi:hypothetical protein
MGGRGYRHFGRLQRRLQICEGLKKLIFVIFVRCAFVCVFVICLSLVLGGSHCAGHKTAVYFWLCYGGCSLIVVLNGWMGVSLVRLSYLGVGCYIAQGPGPGRRSDNNEQEQPGQSAVGGSGPGPVVGSGNWKLENPGTANWEAEARPAWVCWPWVLRFSFRATEPRALFVVCCLLFVFVFLSVSVGVRC